MPPSSPSASASVQQLLAQADQYAEVGLQMLPARQPNIAPEVLTERTTRMRAWLRTSFLFPQLPVWQQGLLVTLYWHRLALDRLVNVPQAELSAPLRAQTERLTARAEAAFMELVQLALATLVFESLSPAQQQVFDHEFARVRFAD